MAARTSDCGYTSIKYTVLRENFHQLVVSCEHVLPQLLAKCFEKQLLSKNELNISGQNEYEKSKLFVEKVLDRVETDSKWYDVFWKIISEIPDLKDIANDIMIKNSCHPPQASEATSCLPQLQAKIKELKKDLDDKEARLKALEKELDKKNQVIADFQKKYDEMNELVIKLTKENESHGEKAKELKAQIYVAELRLAKAGYDLKKASVEKEELKRIINTLRKEKERDALIKDKELALKDKELALKDKELALKGEKLAQEEAKVAQMEAAELQKRLEEMTIKQNRNA